MHRKIHDRIKVIAHKGREEVWWLKKKLNDILY